MYFKIGLGLTLFDDSFCLREKMMFLINSVNVYLTLIFFFNRKAQKINVLCKNIQAEHQTMKYRNNLLKK